MIYVKYVYSAPCYLVDARDLKCGKYMYIHPLYMHIRYLAHMSNLVGIFVFGTYLEV